MISTQVFVLALSPPWDAKYVVPVSGMVVGNVLTATALGCGAFLTDVAERADVVELALARGATWHEAAAPALRSATTCVEIKFTARSSRPPRHRREACSMAWRCRFLIARRSQRGHVIAEK